MPNLTAHQAMQAMEAVIGVLKKKFSNLSANEAATLAKDIVHAFIYGVDNA